MISDRNRAKEIAEAALAVPPEQRREFVDDSCNGDVTLKSAVFELIEAASEQTQLHTDQTHTSRTPSGPQFKADQFIGPYRVIQKLGDGGFGEVYQARQSKPIRRDVAVKVLKRMDSRQVIVRFQAERQALAMMSHPGIAKVFDAGTTEFGQPYFVMELVKGVPVTKFCDLRRVDIRDRVKLFIEICEAVQHAHHKGVVHRDLKPSNLMVADGDNGPLPIVIDFGLAKAMRQQLSEESVVTQIHTLIGTPAYMSPEQAEMSGLDIDTRADVYSLGVVLYELLCGRLPFSRQKMEKASVVEIARILREEIPSRPSQRFSNGEEDAESRAKSRGSTPHAISRSLGRELDWIVMKCLEKDRGKRYATVNGLAADAQRYLDDEPVLARQNTAMYGMRKAISKYRGAAVTALLLFVTLAIGMVASLYLYADARRQAEDVLRLSDLNVLVELERQFPSLTSKDPWSRAKAIDRWMQQAKDPLTRKQLHADTLDRLVARGFNDTEAEQQGFTERAEHWQYDSQRKLVAKLAEFDGPNGMIATVRDWADRAPTQAEVTEAWKRCVDDLGNKHPTWKVTPREDLLPLGKNTETGLWEFADLTTGLPPKEVNERPQAFTGIEYVLVPGGTYQMGSPEDEVGRKPDEPQHEVTVTPFLIAKYETTQSQWKRIQGYHHNTNFPGELLPTPGSWFDAYEFASKLDANLPTEAQWEFACRAGTTGPYAGTNDLDEMGWYLDNSNKVLRAVGLKLPNQFGLYDMHGNATEWVYDRYQRDFYSTAEAIQVNPVNPPSVLTLDEWFTIKKSLTTDQEEENILWVGLRGGPCNGTAVYCRSADRFREHQYVVIGTLSFRLAITNVVELKN